LSTINTTTQMTTAINTTHLAASFATGSAVTYTISSATGTAGKISAGATGGSVQLMINGQTVPIAQDDSVDLTVGLLPGDVDGSGRVDGRDLITLSAAFGSDPTVTSWNANGDLNKSQSVDGSDLVILAAHFGELQ
jgi:Dockerin type I domain